jgi:ferredoxin
MALEIRIHPGKCIATRACINAAPHTFALDHGSIATVINLNGDSEDEVVAAADACPTGAITIFRDGARIA